MVSKRSRNIILELFKKGAVRTMELSSMFKVTERTIRNDLEEIDYFLKNNGFEYLIRDNKKGIQLSESTQSTKLIYKLINQKEVVTASYTKEERILEILYALCTHEKPIKIETLADELLVSKSTIVKDLEKIKKELVGEHIHIHGSLDGIEITGDEATIRSWTVKKFISTMDKRTVIDIIALLEGKSNITTFKVHWRLFENIDLKPYIHYVEILKSSLSTHLEDRLFLQVLGNICFMMKRIAIDNVCESVVGISTSKVSSIVIQQLYRTMHNDCQIPESEKAYVHYLVYIACCDLYEYEHRDNFEDIKQNIKALMKNMSVYMEYQHYDVLYSDVVKETTNMMIEDILRISSPKNIVELHDKPFEDVYTKVKEEVNWLKFPHHSACNDDYWRIAWHFIANRKQDVKKKNILIVSDKSKSLCTILIRKLKMLFDIEIVGVSAHAQVEKYIDSYDIDCIVSTMHIQSDIDVVRVHPLVSEVDIQTLKQHLQTHLKKDEGIPNHSFESYEQFMSCDDLSEFVEQIEGILQKESIVNVNVGNELYANILKQGNDFMIYKNILYMNLRNHEIVNKDTILHIHLLKSFECDEQEITKIEFYACRSSYAYIQYLEASLQKERNML